MERNRQLEGIYLADNPIDHEEDVNKLCEIIKDHPSINRIQLGYCCGEGINGHELLCSIMDAGRNKLTSISLTRNGITTGGSTFISDFLANNPTLERLYLWDNNLDDNDADSIASALKHNTNLRLLDMDPTKE